MMAMAGSPDGKLFLAGETNSSWVEANLGGVDFAAVMLDTGGSATPPPAPTPTGSPGTAPATLASSARVAVAPQLTTAGVLLSLCLCLYQVVESSVLPSVP